MSEGRWQLVPVELTQAMLDATCVTEEDDAAMRATWAELLRVAPSHTPAADEVEAVWNALKEQCCSDPAESTKWVIVYRDQLAAAMQARPADKTQARIEAAEVDAVIAEMIDCATGRGEWSDGEEPERADVDRWQARLQIATGHKDGFPSRPAEPAGEEPVDLSDLGPERYVRDFIRHGEVSSRHLEPWEQAYQDAGHIEMAERRGYIHVGRDVACTITVTDHGRRIAALLNRPATPSNPDRLVEALRGSEISKEMVSAAINAHQKAQFECPDAADARKVRRYAMECSIAAALSAAQDQGEGK